MEGRHLALIASILIWIVGYFISFFYFSHKFSTGIIPTRIRERTNIKTFAYIIIGLPFLSPILSGLMYRIGGIIEEGNGIAWGCYIEDFFLGSFLLWFLSALSLSILLLICLAKPNIFGFQNRKKAVSLYITHHFYTLALLLIIGILIPILSGPLSGKESSCW